MKILRRISSMLVVFTILLSAISVNASAGVNEKYTFDNIIATSRQNWEEVKQIDTDQITKYTVDSVKLLMHDQSANLQIKNGEEILNFNIDLYQAQLGFNAENTIIGLSMSKDKEYELVKFNVEKNASKSSLLDGNSAMEGKTVATIAVHNHSNNRLDEFQVELSNVSVSELITLTEELVYYELAAFGSRPKAEVKSDFLSANLNFEINETETFTKSDENDELKVIPFSTISSSNNYYEGIESQKFSDLIEASKNGSISLNPKTRGLIPDISDSLYNASSYGWTKETGDYVYETSNVRRSIGYAIYHMPNYSTGNTLNYVARFEGFTNINFTSDIYINTFKVTHNVWIEYNDYSNSVYIFDDRAWNARIEIDPDVYIKTSLSSTGYFTHFSTSSIKNGSTSAKIAKFILGYVDYIGDAIALYDTFSSGTQITTGSLHPTNDLGKEIEAEQDNLIRPNDHVTIEGRGTDISTITYGYSYSVTTK